jgi:hypothetical protein
MYESNDEKHAESSKKYPQLSLSDGEFVIVDVKRHPIGLLSIWLIDLLVVGFIIVTVIFVYRQAASLGDMGVAINSDLILGVAMLVTILVLLLGYVGTIYVTNESVIQKIRTGLFASREQIIALSGIEDASYHQDGLLQYMLGYGSIRLSTIGDETTYRFNLVQNPQRELTTLNNAVEEFKTRQSAS